MIANQTGGKATRDAFFLSNFDVVHLPTMLIAASIVTIGLVLTTARIMRRHGPARLVPTAFLVSGMLLLVEWALTFWAPKVAAVVVYLHIAAFGAVLISGFWSLVNERFDPRTAKRKMGRIGAGATLGGLAGGLLAERAAVYLSVTGMLPVLAILHVFCAWRVRAIWSESARPQQSLEARNEVEKPVHEEDSGLQILAKAPYLRNLAALVMLGTVSAALLDYVFKAEAARIYGGGDGQNLLRFFAVFYAGVGLVTFVVQSTLARRSLEKLGLAKTVGTLPVATAVGGIGALLFPGLSSVTAARGTEGVMRSSLYRSGYELLFTPIPAKDKRATKTFVDVGFERLGDAVGGGLVKLILIALPLVAHQTLLGLSISLSVFALFVAARLHKGYVRALETSLRTRADELDIDELEDSTTRSAVLQTLGAMDIKEALAGLVQTKAHSASLSDTEERTRSPDLEPLPDSGAFEIAATKSQQGIPTGSEPVVEQIITLRSGDPHRVKGVLSGEKLDPSLVSHVLPLLAWDEVCETAINALRKIAAEVTGQLVDALVDPTEEFAVRRRIPRVLCWAKNQCAADGLVMGLRDSRFEVRFHCGRGLAYIVSREDGISVDKQQVLDIVMREVKVDRRIWESHRLLDESVDERVSPFVDEVLRNRANRSLEHVFTMLSLALPKQPLSISFKGLHTDDRMLRGTALEYLESVLPPQIRDGLWPFLEDDRRKRRQPELRGQEEILADLLKSNKSIQLNLEALRQKLGRD